MNEADERMNECSYMTSCLLSHWLVRAVLLVGRGAGSYKICDNDLVKGLTRLASMTWRRVLQDLRQ